MPPNIPEALSTELVAWRSFAIMGNAMPPRDPDEDDEDKEDEAEEDEDEDDGADAPPTVREPDED